MSEKRKILYGRAAEKGETYSGAGKIKLPIKNPDRTSRIQNPPQAPENSENRSADTDK